MYSIPPYSNFCSSPSYLPPITSQTNPLCLTHHAFLNMPHIPFNSTSKWRCTKNNFNCILIDIPWWFIICDCLSQQSNGSNSALTYFSQIHWNSLRVNLALRFLLEQQLFVFTNHLPNKTKEPCSNMESSMPQADVWSWNRWNRKRPRAINSNESVDVFDWGQTDI